MPLIKQAIVDSDSLIKNFGVWDGVSPWSPAGVTAGEISSTSNYPVGYTFHVRNSAYTHNIAIEGNSIAKGTAVGVTNVAPMLAVLDAGLTVNDRINVAKDGWTTTDLITFSYKYVDCLYDSTVKNILIFIEGTNDIWSLSKTDVQAYNNIKTYCSTKKSQGWYTIVSTILPRSVGGSFETYRTSVNQMIRDAKTANEPWIDQVADVAAHSIMGVNGGSNNSTYFADGTHPTVAGHLELKSYFTTAINAVK